MVAERSVSLQRDTLEDPRGIRSANDISNDKRSGKTSPGPRVSAQG